MDFDDFSMRIAENIKECQNLVLQSLSEVDSMVALWRQINVIETDAATTMKWPWPRLTN